MPTTDPNDPRPPRPMSPRTYRKNLREVHASLVAEGPVLITSRAGTVALVMAPPSPVQSCTTCAHYRPGEVRTCPDEAAKWGLSWGDEEATEPPPGTPPCPGRVERDG